MNQFDRLKDGWHEMVESLRFRYSTHDCEQYKQLIFETFHFIKNNLNGDTFPKRMLELFKYICQANESLSEVYPDGIEESVAEALNSFILGLICIIENGFGSLYGNQSMPIDLEVHTLAGCAELEANMETYESFIVDFNSDVEWRRAYHNEINDI